MTAAEDRRAIGYEPRFDTDAEFGHQGVLLWEQDIAAIVAGSAEVKRDARWCCTGNLYVERRSKNGGVWQPSGIVTTEAELWITVLGDTGAVLIVPTGHLRELARDLYACHPSHYRGSQVAGANPTKGVLVPLGALVTRYLPALQHRIEGGRA